MPFFSEFSGPGRVWTEFGTKFFFSLFLGLCHPVLSKNKAGKRFFNFLNFFAISFGIFILGRVWTEFGTKIFFFSFSAYVSLFFLKIMPDRGFLIFWFFFNFFWNFLARVKYERKSGGNFFFLHFFGLSHPVLAKNNVGKWIFNFLIFFLYLFQNFLLGSIKNGIRE